MAKSKIEVIAQQESFENLSSFTELEEMNKTIRTYKDIVAKMPIRKDSKDRLVKLLDLLKRHSCKHLGVSFMCKNTLAKKMELSYKTVQRLMKKLNELGMIKQIPMKRKSDMMQTANAVIITPFEEVTDKVPAKMTDKCPTNKTTTPSLKQKSNNKLKERKETVSLPKINFVSHWVNKRFAKFASNFFDSAKTIQELWKVVKQNNGVIDYENGTMAFTKEEELEIGITAIKELVMKIKDGKKITNLFGYFNGIVDKVMTKYFDETYECLED